MGKFKGVFRDAPWMGVDAIKKIEKIITPQSVVLETGAGSSTLWLVSRVTHVTSFEHQSPWAAGVVKELQKRRISKAYYDIYCDPDYPGEGIRDLENRINHFDLIIIDGRGRVKSVKTTADLLKPGGWMVLDNANRPRYEGARLFLATLGWIAIDIQSRVMPENKRGFTTFWRKPFDDGEKD